MFSSITTSKMSSNELSLQIKKIKIMKWILNLEKSEQEFSFKELQTKIDEICYQNYTNLIVINHYLSLVTNKIKNSINQVLQVKDNPELCKTEYFKYIKNCRKNSAFLEYERYIYVHRTNDVICDVEESSEDGFIQRLKKIEIALIKHKSSQLAILFNILAPDKIFNPSDIMENLPQINYWINENKNKPIQDLTNDECEIITAHLYHLTYDDILEKLNLSSSEVTYNDINKIIQGLPLKFGVANMTQVMFRIFLLKPHIWRQATHENIIAALKDIQNEIE